MRSQNGNYGFSAPVVFRSVVVVPGKGIAVTREARLVVNVDKLTELAFTVLREY